MTSSTKEKISTYPMFVQVRPDSEADIYWRKKCQITTPKLNVDPTALAPNLPRTPQRNLIYRGGHLVPNMHYANMFIEGKSSWDKNEMKSVDNATIASMQDPRLNRILAQYFNNKTPQCNQLPSRTVKAGKVDQFDRQDLESLITGQFEANELNSIDFSRTLLNFMLPPGVVLGIDPGDTATSLNGLGGYHGSFRTPSGQKIYYAIAVYSEQLDDGTQNGIPVFDENWKNVVATNYHELNEFRTDPDVQEAITTGNELFLGWTSPQGEEIGDFPIFEAANLHDVFKEIKLVNNLTVPMQLLYSNSDDGPGLP